MLKQASILFAVIYLVMVAVLHNQFYKQQDVLPTDDKQGTVTKSAAAAPPPPPPPPKTTVTTTTTVTTAATAASSTLHPPCNTSGTYYLFGGKYHHHPDSTSFRRALSEKAYDTPHHQHDPGSSMGILYAVAGTEGFINSAFVPIVEHLRDTVGIPNVYERQAQARTQEQPPQQWGLAMDPFTCNLLSRPSEDNAPILPFFDVLIIITPDDLQRENSNTTFWDPVEHTKAAAAAALEKKKRTKAYGVTSKTSDKTIMGVVSWGDRTNRRLRHYVMGFKVLALAASPFPITSFIDVDLIPCRKDFDVQILEDVQKLVRSNNYSLFDVAVTDVQASYGLNHPSHEDPTHYILSRRFNASMANELYDSNLHNTMCTVLNMTSPRTHDWLKRAIDHYFETPNGHLKQIDQPSLGEAMYDTWKFYRSTHDNNNNINNSTNNDNDNDNDGTHIDSGFRHIDMSLERICRNAQIRKNLLMQGCPKAGAEDEDEKNQCLLVHKTTGEKEEKKARKRGKRRKGK